MTPPPAATHAEADGLLSAQRPFLGAGLSWHGLARTVAANWARLRLLVHVLALCMAGAGSLFAIASRGINVSDRLVAAVFPVVTLVVMRVRRRPEERLRNGRLDATSYVLGDMAISAMLAIALDSVLGGAAPLSLGLRLWMFGSVYLVIAEGGLLSIRKQGQRVHGFSTPTLIVGAGLMGEHLVKRLHNDPTYGLRPVGFLDADPIIGQDSRLGSQVPLLGCPDDLDDAIARTGARHVILAFSRDPDRTLVERVRACQERGIEVSLVPRLYESITERTSLHHIGGIPLMALRQVNPKGWEFAVKHTLDRVVAALALGALAPLLLAIAVAVRRSSPGPVMFRQRRVGRDGQVFDLLKFRTMRIEPAPQRFQTNGEKAPGGVEGDDRRTWVGTWLRELSLDELPQLINVLRGEMSLIGPRPERPEYVEQFVQNVERYGDRHRVKSGITGWAQVHGLKGQTSIPDRVEWDNYYIRNWSLGLDLRIVMMTFAAVFRFRESRLTSEASDVAGTTSGNLTPVTTLPSADPTTSDNDEVRPEISEPDQQLIEPALEPVALAAGG